MIATQGAIAIAALRLDGTTVAISIARARVKPKRLEVDDLNSSSPSIHLIIFLSSFWLTVLSFRRKDASRISVMAPTRTADMGFDSRGRADAHGEHDSHGVLDNRLAGRVDVPMGGGEYPETVPLAGNPGPSTAFPPPGSRGRAVVDGTRPGRRSPELPYDDEDSHYPRDLPGGGSQGPARPGLYRSSPDSHRRLVPRSPSPLGRMGGGAHRPTSTVILEGLPAAVLEDDILDGFSTASGPSVFRAEDVKAVRLRNNKRGRRIGFVEFYRVADAEEFVEYHYPSLEFNLAHSRGVDSEPITVGINYSRGREDDNRDDRDRGRDGDEWTCREVSCIHNGTIEYSLT